MDSDDNSKQSATPVTTDVPSLTIQEILLRENYVTQEDINKAEEFSKKNDSSITDYLLSENLITKELLGKAIAESFGVSYADLELYPPTVEQILQIPEELAQKFNIVVYAKNDEAVVVATGNPLQYQLLNNLASIFPEKRIVIAYSFPEDIKSSFSHYKKNLEARFINIILQEQRIAPEIIEEIINDALTFGASDIHFEPQEKETLVRFRVDGVLSEVGRIPKEYYENILNRIKILANLRIDEHFSSQDGAIRFIKDDKTIDLRLSVMPTIEGEKAAIRLLSKYISGFTLGDLGLSEKNQKILNKNTQKPFGMILVTGPTGSGKTTTFYSVIKILNNKTLNIVTIEDPVEYKILGINQIQVNAETDITFAKGLKSILRQDPNIILVGEIRDLETAEISINAALTGQLLFSTFHTNDAASAIPRLLDMGVEPFLLASTLELLISQRLVRKICESCRHSYSSGLSDLVSKYPSLERYFVEENVTLYTGKGCNYCGNSGYKGRTGIFEIIEITSEMEDLILKNSSAGEIRELARKQGSESLFEDGMEKVKNGITTIKELLRVAGPQSQ